ncbi:MAG TPA: hypothetical protein V6C58_24575 [Allocoleopsis sp.]
MFRIEIKNSLNEVTNAAEFETSEQCNNWYLSLKETFDLSIPDHTYSITNIESELKERMLDQESSEAIDVGNKVIKEIRKLNRKKLKKGDWTNEQFQSLLANSTAASIERALWNGSLNTADFLISSMTAFYSNQEIQNIKNIIKVHEDKWRNVF